MYPRMTRRQNSVHEGTYQISVGTPKPKMVLGTPSTKRPYLETRLRCLAYYFASVSGLVKTDGMTALILTIPPHTAFWDNEGEAFERLVHVLSKGNFTHLEFSWSPYEPEEDDLTFYAIECFFDQLRPTAMRHLRIPNLNPDSILVLRQHLCEVQTVVTTRDSASLGDIAEFVADNLLFWPNMTGFCLRGDMDHCLPHCTCWESMADGTFPFAEASERQKQLYRPYFDAVRQTMAARRRELKMAQVTAIGVMFLAEFAYTLPPELWAIVWGYLGGDSLSPTQVKRAVKLVDGEASLSKRATAMGHLHGDEFNAALEEWLVKQGFGLVGCEREPNWEEDSREWWEEIEEALQRSESDG